MALNTVGRNSRQRNFNGENLWARGYAVSTAGFEESQIRSYIRNQEQLDSKSYDEKGNF
jgi:putative transposase